MFSKNSRTRTLLLFILVFALVATAAGAYVAISPDNRTDKFFLSIASLLFAEIVVFGYPIYLFSIPTIANHPKFTAGIGTHAMLCGYGFSVIVISFVAMTSITISWLILLHLATLGIAVILFFVCGIASSELHAIAVEEDGGRRFVSDCRKRIILLSEAPNLPDDVRATLNRLREVAQFSASESKPATSPVESKISKLLEQLEEKSKLVCDKEPSIDFNEEIINKSNILMHHFRERELSLRS